VQFHVIEMPCSGVQKHGIGYALVAAITRKLYCSFGVSASMKVRLHAHAWALLMSSRPRIIEAPVTKLPATPVSSARVCIKQR
jgi:hypothetical protein